MSFLSIWLDDIKFALNWGENEFDTIFVQFSQITWYSSIHSPLEFLIFFPLTSDLPKLSIPEKFQLSSPLQSFHMRLISKVIRTMTTVDLTCKWFGSDTDFSGTPHNGILTNGLIFYVNWPNTALRLKYRSEKEVFLEQNIEVKDPFHLFRAWLNEACQTPEILEPNAFCLSTVSKLVLMPRQLAWIMSFNYIDRL